MRISILGKIWNLRFTSQGIPSGYDGDCDPPDKQGKEIRVRSTLKGVDRLETILHECAHASQWHLDEDFVTQLARDQARILWRLGYREIEL